MPKFTYSASKGIEQSSGSGFVINDVSIVEGSEDVTGGGNCNTYGVNILAGAATLPDPSDTTAGQKVTIIGAGGLVTVTSGGNFTPAANAVAVLVWTGSLWFKISV